jgi:hypothetical protein
MKRKCPHCKKSFQPVTGAANRADKAGSPLYCSRACSGLARRVNRSPEDKKAAKAEYDRKRRAELGESLRAEKRAAYYANHDTNKARAAELRKTAEYKAKHLVYLSTPEYRAKKQEYDVELRKAGYGDFAETWRLLLDLEKEIRSQQSSYERRKARGYYTRASITRRREAWQARKNLTQAT